MSMSTHLVISFEWDGSYKTMVPKREGQEAAESLAKYLAVQEAVDRADVLRLNDNGTSSYAKIASYYRANDGEPVRVSA